MHSAVDNLPSEVKAQLDQTCANLQKYQETVQQTVDQLAAGLDTLTKHLNAYKPASTKSVGDCRRNFIKKWLKNGSVRTKD